MDRLDVRKSRLTIVCVVLLGLIVIPIGCGLVVSGLSGGIQWTRVAMGLLLLATLGLTAWIIHRGDRKSICYVTDEGVTRNDGHWLPWANLVRVVDRVRFRSDGRKLTWRTEMEFQDGETAWLIPTKVTNYGEIYRVVRGRGSEYLERSG